MPLSSVGRAQLGRPGKQTASAEHARLSPEDRTRLFEIVGRPRRVRRFRVVAPLPGVAEHIEYSQVVGLQAPYARRPALRITVAPGVAIKKRVGAAVGTAGDGPGPASVFPLGLGG